MRKLHWSGINFGKSIYPDVFVATLAAMFAPLAIVKYVYLMTASPLKINFFTLPALCTKKTVAPNAGNVRGFARSKSPCIYCMKNCNKTMYKLPLKTAQAEFIEKKSHFIGHISPVTSEEEARAFLQQIRAKHPEASHNVFAYRLKENNISRHNDDGEPSGSAGLPLLSTFLKSDVFDFCCVATRYYGGIPLGAGGLVRAYSKCGSAALAAAGVGEKRELQRCSIVSHYPLYETIKRVLNDHQTTLEAEDFGVAVTLTFTLLTETLENLQKIITEKTSGAIQINKIDTCFAVIPISPK